MFKLSRFALMAGFFALAIGCSGTPSNTSTASVKGKVLLANGSPVVKGNIVFTAEAGVVMDDTFAAITNGDFEMKVAPGKYQISVEPAYKRAQGKPETSPIPQKYWHPKTANIEETITSSGNPSLTVTLK